MLWGYIYFEYATLVHKLHVVTSFHPNLAVSALEKLSNLLIPQTPHFFGSARNSHLAHAKKKFSTVCPSKQIFSKDFRFKRVCREGSRKGTSNIQV